MPMPPTKADQLSGLSQNYHAQPAVTSDKDHNSLFRLNDQMGHELRIFFNNKQNHSSNVRSINHRNGMLDRTTTSK